MLKSGGIHPERFLVSIRIILLSAQEEVTKSYRGALEALNIQLDTVASFFDLYQAMVATAYQGLMIDLPTKVRATPQENALVRQLQEAFPFVYLRWDSKTGTIRPAYPGQPQEEMTLEEFFEKRCRPFGARRIRANPRKLVHFNVILSSDESFQEKYIERVVTINVSKGGCFIYSAQKWGISNQIWLVLKELGDPTPMVGRVKQCIEWGSSMQIPGIGMSFESIAPAQFEELCLKARL